MAGLADLLYLGQPNPARQIAAMLSGQPQPGQQSAGPNGPPTPNGPTPDPASPAPNPAPGAPTPPGSPPQPAALQSSPDMSASYQALSNPPSLMSLYLQLDQRQRASDQINRGFALIAANHAGNPAMMRNIMDSVSGGGGDAGSTVSNLMSLYSGQQQMAAQQDMLKNADAWDQKLNLPPGTSRDMILAGRGNELIKSMEPTEQQRNIQAEHDAYIKSGGSEEDWKNNYLPMIITGGLPGMTGDMRSMSLARTQWMQDPANKNRPMPGYLTDPTKWSLYNHDLMDAKGQFNGMSQALGSYINDLSDVANSPKLGDITGQGIGGTIAERLKAAVPGSDEYTLMSKMQGLQSTSKAIAARGGPKGVGQNLAILGADTDAFTNTGVKDYLGNVIAPRMKNALTAQANAYGAAGRLADMPGYLKAYLDPMYQAGGDLDPGGPSKAFTANKDLKQPTEADLVDFRNYMERYGPEAALKRAEKNGYDTSSLR